MATAVPARLLLLTTMANRGVMMMEMATAVPARLLLLTTMANRGVVMMARYRPTGSETTPPYAPRSSRFGSEPPSVEDDVNVWCS